MRRPFISRTLNDIEDLSLITGIITIYCAIFFITSRSSNSVDFNSSTDYELSDEGALIIFGIIIAANLAFLLTWVAKFIGIIRALIKERYQRIYVCLFLCCRADKLHREGEEQAKEAKREGIIEKIEEIQFFFKDMKNLYERTAFYEGHARFMRILYFIEHEKSLIDLTEKKYNYRVSGKMARDRKLDPERMKEILDEHMLKIDDEFVELAGPKSQKVVKIGQNVDSNSRFIKLRKLSD